MKSKTKEIVPHNVRVMIDCDVLAYLPEGTPDKEVMDFILSSGVMVCGNSSWVFNIEPVDSKIRRPKY